MSAYLSLSLLPILEQSVKCDTPRSRSAGTTPGRSCKNEASSVVVSWLPPLEGLGQRSRQYSRTSTGILANYESEYNLFKQSHHPQTPIRVILGFLLQEGETLEA